MRQPEINSVLIRKEKLDKEQALGQRKNINKNMNLYKNRVKHEKKNTP